MNWDGEIVCPAKINLHLEVGPLRPDGYHELLSLFHLVDLCDTISVRSLKTSELCGISGNFSFSREQNTVYKAAMAFKKAAGIRDGFEFHVDKRIPQGAGLGGGSSDAAGTLRLLNALYDNALPVEVIANIGGTIGSDVPFFLSFPAAVVTGRGEIVEPLDPLEGLWCLLGDSGVHISTAEAYRWVDASGNAVFSGNKTEILERYQGLPEKWDFYNTFEEPVFQRYPVLRSLKEGMLQEGAVHACLSGSGAVVYGLFQTPEEAVKAGKTGHANVRFLPVKMLARFHNAILQ